MTSPQEVAKMILEGGEYAKKREELNSKKETLKNGKSYLIEMSNEVMILEKELEGATDLDEGLVETLKSELEKVNSISLVSDAHFDGRKIVAYTDWLVAETQNGNQLPIPPCKVSLDLETSEFLATVKTAGTGASGYWTNDDPHPHINGNDGDPCIGTASCSITAMVAAKEYYAAFLMCIDFLQTVNENDSAGKRYHNWIDKHSEKLEELLA